MIRVNGRKNSVSKDTEVGGHRPPSGNRVLLCPGAQGVGSRGPWEPQWPGLPEHTSLRCQASNSHPKLWAQEKQGQGWAEWDSQACISGTK